MKRLQDQVGNFNVSTVQLPPHDAYLKDKYETLVRYNSIDPDSGDDRHISTKYDKRHIDEQKAIEYHHSIVSALATKQQNNDKFRDASYQLDWPSWLAKREKPSGTNPFK